MPLLQWCTLQPQGPSKLAAIRFTAPIQISSIRVFPKGASPFSEAPDIVAETEPEAFFLDIFFNAQPIHPNANADQKEKQRAPNALVPTTIAYAGGQMDFAVDMGTEHATRLMIVKGDFGALSMAIYGEIVTETPPVQSYEPKPLPLVEPFPLSRSIDPASTPEPRSLAENLLSLISNSPPLPLVVRLMFCLKPSDENWDDPEFPYLYADLENKDGDFDLEGLVNSISRPIQDDTPPESFMTLVSRVNDFLGPTDNDQAYYIAKLLSIAAPQHPEMARTLLQNIDLSSIFDENTLDESTMLCLLDACANRDIAKHFSNIDSIFSTIQGLRGISTADQNTRSAADRLFQRITGWQYFEDALGNESQDFEAAASFLKDVCSEENSTGIWLSCMLLNEDLVMKLNSTIPASGSQSIPPVLFRHAPAPVGHDEFVTFIRALVGIVCVLAAWAWADSLGNDLCRERTLALLNLWQCVEGYSNIVNHLLHLRQLTRRLGWIISDSDPPRKSGIFAERILSNLAEEPSSLLQEELIKTILSLKQPLSFITEEDRLTMRKSALVAEDGLAAAVEEILFTSDRPFSLRRLRTMRVSMAIIQNQFGDANGEWRILNSFWNESAHGIVARLVDILAVIAGDINRHFELQPMPKMDYKLLAHLFLTVDDLLRLIGSASSGFPLTSRSLRKFTIAATDVFICSGLAQSSFARMSPVYSASRGTRSMCLNIVATLQDPAIETENPMLNAQVILRTLLGYAAEFGNRDPVQHILQIFILVNHLLPDPEEEEYRDYDPSWMPSLLPKVLPELKAFFRLLDKADKFQLLHRLVKLDGGITGIGEWLLMEELKFLLELLQELSQNAVTTDLRMVFQHQVSESIDFLLSLATPSSTMSEWYKTSLSSDEGLSQLHLTVFEAALDGYYSSTSLTRLVQILAKEAGVSDPALRYALFRLLLRAAQLDPTIPGISDNLLTNLNDIPSAPLSAETFGTEFGLALASFAHHVTSLEGETAGVLLSVLEWSLAQEDTSFAKLKGLKLDDLASLCDFFLMLHPDREAAVSDIRTRITIDEDELFAPSIVELPTERVHLSLNAIEDLLHPREDQPPSTPRAGNKTPDILGTVISPPTALLRSPAATGLTKTYANNDFRQLRQVPTARLNTSRLPSMHGTPSAPLVVT